MAKKTRKKPTKGKRATTKAKRKTRATKRRKMGARKSRPKRAEGKLSRAAHIAWDTIKGTDALRNKYEPPGSSETE
jgi:hypothetical protein